MADRPRLRLTVVVAALVAAAVGVGAIAVARSHHQPAATAAIFSPYVDVTLAPPGGAADPAPALPGGVVFAFVTGTGPDGCTPGWAGETLDDAATRFTVDRRVAAERSRGAPVAVAFGGYSGTELAVGCRAPDRLVAAYRSVVDRYRVGALDVDLEGTALTDPAAVARRAEALAALQRAPGSGGAPLRIWLTLPVTPAGLTSDGVRALGATLTAGVRLAGVNALTMDYGPSRSPSMTMAEAATGALDGLSAQLVAAFRGAGVMLSERDTWNRVGATPMIGQNDVASDRFDLSAAADLATFARRHGLGRISMWSLNRDRACSHPVPAGSPAQPDCSGVAQAPSAFTRILGAG
jgi:chitinase